MPPRPAPDAALIVAGGAARRMGGVDKPAVVVDGRSLLETALASVTGSSVVVIGPPRALPPDITQTREDPPGGGPAAAIAAGVAQLSGRPGTAIVAVLAADLPGVRAAVISELTATLRDDPLLAGVVAADAGGHPQWLLSVWRLAAVRDALATRPSWSGMGVRQLLGGLRRADVTVDPAVAADLDSPADLARWTGGNTGGDGEGGTGEITGAGSPGPGHDGMSGPGQAPSPQQGVHR